MGLTFSIDHARGEMFTTAEGRITYEDIRLHLAEERAAGALGYPELVDARTASPDISSDDVRRVVSLLDSLSRNTRLGPTAVVVASDVAFGMMRMLEILVEPICLIEPFRDYDAASKWLCELQQGAR